MRSVLLPFVCAAVTFASVPASARGSARLAYTYPADLRCPDERALRGLISTHLGYDAFAETSPVRVQATIERAGARLRGRVVLMRERTVIGERILDAANDCSSVAQALALTVAVAIDTLDEASLRAPEPRPPAAAEAPGPSEPTPARPDPPAEVPVPAEPSRPLSFRVTAGLTGSLGVAPSLAMGGFVGLGARARFLSVDLEGRADLPAGAPLSTGGDIRTSLAVGTLAPCAHYRRLVGCAVVTVGAMHGESRSVAKPASGVGLFGAAGPRLGLELPLSRSFALAPRIDVLVTWARPELEFDRAVVWSAAPVSGTVGVALLFDPAAAGGF